MTFGDDFDDFLAARPAQRDWDRFQNPCIAAMVTGPDSVCSAAVPGSGKTTCINEALWRLPVRLHSDIVITAAGVRIIQDIARRAPSGVYARNLHKIGYRAVCNRFGDGIRVAETMQLVGEFASGLERAQRDAFRDLVRLSKERLAEKHEEIIGLIIEGEVDCGREEPDELAQRVLDALDRSREPIDVDGDRCIDFTDMLWLPVIHGLSTRSAAIVVMEEVQDFSPAMIALALRVAGKGRVIAAGDPLQAIFGFAGALPTALEDVAGLTRAKMMPLSVSYRCAAKIVDLAKKINPQMEARAGAPDGVVRSMHVREMIKELREGDVVLSRKNAPLLPLCMKLVIEGKPATVWGKDFGQRLATRVRSWRPDTLPDLRAKVDSWERKRIDQLEAQGRSADSARDEAESIGIRKSKEALADADMVLMVLDSSQPPAAEDRELFDQVAGRPAIVVANKTDLRCADYRVPNTKLSRVETSALTGQGIPELRAEILARIGGESGVQTESGLLTSVRHQGCVRSCLAALDAAQAAVHASVPHEMLLLDLYNALRPLDEITGATTTDDILNLIFSTFCIGK